MTFTNFGDASLPTVMNWTDASCTVMHLASAVLLLEVAVLVHCQRWTLTRYSEYRSSETRVPQVPLGSSTVFSHHSILPVLPSGYFIAWVKRLSFVRLVNSYFILIHFVTGIAFSAGACSTLP